MANQLKVTVAHAIEVLFERGWSQRRIAAVSGIDLQMAACDVVVQGDGVLGESV